MKSRFDKKRYIITAAQARAAPNKGFMRAIESYGKGLDAEVVILPMIGHSASQDVDQLHKFFDDQGVFEQQRRALNTNIDIEEFNVRPYQIDPLTGLARFVQRGTSKIFASPKQRSQTLTLKSLTCVHIEIHLQPRSILTIKYARELHTSIIPNHSMTVTTIRRLSSHIIHAKR